MKSQPIGEVLVKCLIQRLNRPTRLFVLKARPVCLKSKDTFGYGSLTSKCSQRSQVFYQRFPFKKRDFACLKSQQPPRTPSKKCQYIVPHQQVKTECVKCAGSDILTAGRVHIMQLPLQVCGGCPRKGDSKNPLGSDVIDLNQAGDSPLHCEGLTRSWSSHDAQACCSRLGYLEVSSG